MLDKNGIEIQIGDTVIHYFKNGTPNKKGIVEIHPYKGLIIKVTEMWNRYKRENSLLSSKVIGGWDTVEYNTSHYIKENNIYEIVNR